MSTSSAAFAGRDVGGAGVYHRRWALVLLCVVQFMVILDTSIVNVALPSIRADLGFSSQASLQYVISLYALTFGGFLILAGRVADLFGRRRLFIAGLVVFAVASLVCGLAASPAWLLAGRAAQGLGAATASPAALSLLTTVFAEGHERNRALGAWGAAGGAAGGSGLILGGLLTSTAGWEWAFFINLPLAAGATLAAVWLLPSGRAATTDRRVDLPGALTITAGLGLVIFALTRAADAGFAAASTLGMLAGAAGLLAGFVVIEQRARRPIVAFRLFRLSGVAGANLVALLLTTVIASQLFFTTLYVQQVLGLSPLATGVAFLPNSIMVLAGSALASRITGRIGTGKLLAAGMATIAAGSLLLAGISPEGSYLTDVLPGFALTGLGLGMAFVVVTVGATTGVDTHHQGLASGVVNTAQQVGSAFGIAAIVTIALTLSGVSGDAGTERLVAGYSIGYLLDTALAGLAAILAVILVRTNPRRRLDQ